MSSLPTSPDRHSSSYAWPLGWAILVAALEGTGVMVVELGAARLMTPYFGQSQYVWSNIIGVVLAAIALGNFVGGMMADKWPKTSVLASLLALAAVSSAACPWIVGPVAGSFLESTPEFEWAFEFLAKGSFLTTIFVFAPPVFLLGTTLPFFVRFACQDPDRVGSRSGAIYAASTLGSILGTFLTSYVLIGTFGSTKTFLFAGGLITLAAVMSMVVGRGRIDAKSIAVLLAVVGSLGASAMATQEFDESVLVARESRYQFIRVVEPTPGHRWLCLNEGLDSFHSITIEGQIHTDGQYYDYHNLLIPLADKGRERAESDPFRVAILGSAAGTQARQILAYFGESKPLLVDGVEIDPEVIEIGYEWMGMPRDERLRVHAVDARPFLRFTDHRENFDLVLIDAYAKQAYIPFYMTTVEFFEEVETSLRDGGVVGINVSAFSRADPVLRAIVNTMAKVFGTVIEARIPQARNFLVYGAKGNSLPHLAELNHESLHPDLQLCAEAFSGASGLVERTYSSSLPLLTDDWAPIENLEDDMLKRRAARLEESLRNQGPR